MVIESNLTGATVCNLTGNSSCDTVVEETWVVPTSAKIIMYILYSSIFLCGTIGNGIVVVILGRKRRNTTSGDVFIISLAIVDFLASVFIPINMINDLATNFEVWVFGEWGCKLLPSTNPLLVVASSWTLVAIAIDRYRLILRPFNRRMEKRYTVMSFVAIWSLAIGMSAPYFIVLDLDAEGFCWDHWENQTHQFAFFCTLDIMILPVPLTIMVIFYAMSSRSLKLSISKLTDGHAIKDRLRQNKKVTKMFIIIVTTYFVLTTPYITFNFFDNYLQVFHREIHNKNTVVVLMLNYGLFTVSATNSCVNPLIYTKMHREVSTSLRTQWRKISTSVSQSFRRLSFSRHNSSASSTLSKGGSLDRIERKQSKGSIGETVLLRKANSVEHLRSNGHHASRKKDACDHRLSRSNSVDHYRVAADFNSNHFEAKHLLSKLHVILEEHSI